jgi:hypothetical protein
VPTPSNSLATWVRQSTTVPKTSNTTASTLTGGLAKVIFATWGELRS